MKAKLATLSQVIFEIFGDMFFLFPEELSDNPWIGSSWHRVCITMSGNAPCRLVFHFGQATAKVMTGNYLGMEVDSITKDMIVDVLKESVNVMGGNLLNLQNDDSILGIPEYLGICETFEPVHTDRQLDFLLEEELFRVILED